MIRFGSRVDLYFENLPNNGSSKSKNYWRRNYNSKKKLKND